MNNSSTLTKTWDYAPSTVVSRFYRPPGSRELVFGNSIPGPIVDIDKKTGKPIDSSAARRGKIFSGIMALVGPIHTMYSRSLLLSARKVMSVLH